MEVFILMLDRQVDEKNIWKNNLKKIILNVKDLVLWIKIK